MHACFGHLGKQALLVGTAGKFSHTVKDGFSNAREQAVVRGEYI